MRIKGHITTWNDEKGFGFITPDDGGKQVFIHISDVNNRTRRPELNQEVVYTLSHDKQKRVCAKNATLTGDKLKKKPRGVFSLTLAISFLASVTVAVKGDHHQFKHPGKQGKVTVPHPKKDIAIGTLRNVFRQAGWDWRQK